MEKLFDGMAEGRVCKGAKLAQEGFVTTGFLCLVYSKVQTTHSYALYLDYIADGPSKDCQDLFMCLYHVKDL